MSKRIFLFIERCLGKRTKRKKDRLYAVQKSFSKKINNCSFNMESSLIYLHQDSGYSPRHGSLFSGQSLELD